MEPNQAIPTTEQVLAAVRQMNVDDLEKVVGEAVSARASKLFTRLPDEELHLLEVINASAPPEVEQRFRELRKAFASEVISPEGYQELLELTEFREKLHVERMTAVAALAKLRGRTLPEVMTQLGIQFPENV